MKKYFIKYLPVDGEIREGDICWDGNSNPFEGDSPYYKVESKEDIPPSHFPDRKVKLFLCSRDIQVGDKNVYLDGSVKINIDNKENLRVATKTGLSFKVIGELSPDALVDVNAEMEVEERNVKFKYAAHTPLSGDFTDTFETNEKDWLKNKNNFIAQKWIEIKCPTCGRFH